MFAWVTRSYEWMGASIHSRYAEFILGFLFYVEAIFFLPTDPMLIVFCLERQDRAWRYATIALIGSILGGMSSYLLGALLWNYFGQQILHNHYINYILTPQRFFEISDLFQQYEWGAMLIAGFTPIPFKAATLAAGFCKLSFAPFVACSIIARGARFYLVAGACILFGEHVKDSFQKYFNLILGIILLLLVFSIWIFT